MLVAGGATNVTTYFVLRKTSDGTAATGLTIANIDLQYVRSGVAPVAKVDAVALAATDTAHTDNRAIEIDATDQPGLYRVDWPDAAFAAGVREVILSVKVATAFTEHLRVEIDGEVNVVEWAGTDVVAGAIPAVAADGVGGLPISDAGGLDLDAMNVNINDIETDTADMQPRVVAIEVDTGTTLQAELDGIQADTEDIQTRLPAALVNSRMDSTIDATGFEAAAVDLIWDEDATGHQTQGTFGQAIGDPGADADTIYGAVVTGAAGANVAVDIIAIKAETALIVADTNELQTDDIPGTIAALNDLSAAEVNTEVLDVMNTDTITLPGQEAPPLAPTHRQAISWLYKVFRNRKTQTSTDWKLLADDETTVDAKATVSDDGTTAIKQEVVTGP